MFIEAINRYIGYFISFIYIVDQARTRWEGGCVLGIQLHPTPAPLTEIFGFCMVVYLFYYNINQHNIILSIDRYNITLCLWKHFHFAFQELIFKNTPSKTFSAYVTVVIDVYEMALFSENISDQIPTIFEPRFSLLFF